MTREEAIDVLNKSIKAGSKVPWLTIVEAVELAIQALSVSLPEGLGETPKKRLRKIGWIAEVKKEEENLEKAVAELRRIRVEKNLDAAAEESWVEYEYRESPKGLYSSCYVDGFKAGAEWMAGKMK